MLSQILDDLCMVPRVRGEDGKIPLRSRVLTLNVQKATGGDVECIRFFEAHLALGCGGATQIDFDSHDRHPSHERSPGSTVPLPSLFRSS